MGLDEADGLTAVMDPSISSGLWEDIAQYVPTGVHG